jgi:hypothetical protein
MENTEIESKKGPKVKYFNSIWSKITRFWKQLFGRDLKATTAKPKTDKPYEPTGAIGGKGHYFESMGAIERSFHCRSSQNKRRKLARRHG